MFNAAKNPHVDAKNVIIKRVMKYVGQNYLKGRVEGVLC